MGKYFGTDGIRGIAGQFLDAKLAFKIGQSLKNVLKSNEIVIGQDTRISSDMLATNLAAGALSTGANVLIAGVVSTPMIAYYAREKAMTGIMITASHNPYHDNGIKIFNKGYKCSEKEEQLIESIVDDANSSVDVGFGSLTHSHAVDNFYKTLYQSLDLEPINMSIGFDSANGANYKIAKEILKPLCDETVQINAEPDGTNINRDCGATHIEALKALMKDRALDLGFSFDGDGDRVLVMDHQLKLYDGDLIVYAIAKHLKETDALKKNTVVLTKMSNPGVLKAFKALGIKTVLTDVGDKHIAREIQNHGYAIGGENSGHIILNHLLHTGDGLLVAVYLLKILQAIRTPLSSYIDEVTMFPQKMVNIPNIDKAVLDEKPIKDAIKAAQKTLGPESLLLIRPSGTEPLIRVTVAHEDESVLDQTIEMLVNTIEKTGRNEVL